MQVSVVLPLVIRTVWQRHMTEASIKSLVDCTSIKFRLIVVETESKEFAPEYRPESLRNYIDNYFHVEKLGSATRDINKGISFASEFPECKYIVYTGNDILVKDQWLESLLDCFKIPDCGAATLGAAELGHVEMNYITEGVYGPIFMFRKGWMFDESFPGPFADSDLIMRIYMAGWRMYRNHRVVVIHPNQVTDKLIHTEEERRQRFEEAKNKFIQKHADSPLFIFRGLAEGWRL